ncbi:TadE/TadG family type IV pilus assembly protein [Sphingomonas sp. LHG3406-1]|uniref:TadE/TadG family type IV pilus assembly protein n=1 Tax=Sphingomonas sp. LHG3406-1 TaxID=2804617 RepID=UPI0026066C1D|nr:TadE/TadG family type IV pilus assembly protein [Sphingomonas sp. LHG3406-1]
MITRIARLARSRSGAAGAEFALVLPLFLLLFIGIIDVGRFFWELNKGEKATQVGARMAIVTTPVSPGLIAHNFATGTVPAGSQIPASELTGLKCTSTECVCEGTCAISNLAADATAFDAVVARMKKIHGGITASNVIITYRGSGFGQAGQASGTMEISPLITVTLTGMQFSPGITLGLLNFNMPAFSTTLTAEDVSGIYSE